MKKLLHVILLLSFLGSNAQTYTREQFKSDFDFFWQTVSDNYCYFQKKQVAWDSLQPLYAAQLDTVISRSGFISVLERALNELYDHHCSLRSNTRESRRLVPTGTDIWAEYHNNRPTVIEVRKNFGAERAGIMAGMEIIAVNDVPVEKAILPFLSHTVTNESKSYALRLLLAGNHYRPRKITARYKNHTADYFPDRDGLNLENVNNNVEVESKRLGNIGYLRINNYLYDNKLISKFDSVLNLLFQTHSLIIDLRETPSGGNTTVARAILGRFFSKEGFYQKHELWAEEKNTGIKRSWVEIVSPRKSIYTKPVVVLEDHWTGSVAEGIVIAFDGTKRATVIGTEMARLNGAIESFEMPITKIGFNIPTEKLYHINGLPREQFEPAIKVNMSAEGTGKDLILQAGINYLQKGNK